MADKPIVQIPIDSSEFDAFVEKFEKFRTEAAEGVDPLEGAAKSAEAAEKATDGMGVAFAAFARAAASSKMTGNSSFSFQFAKNIHNAANDTKEIDKNLAKTDKSLLAINRRWAALKSVGKMGLGLLGIPLAIGGAAAKAASDIAKDNQRNRELSVEPGTVPAFNNGFRKFGLSDSDVARVRDAATNPDKWKAFALAGLNPQDAQNMDPTELTAYLDKWAGGKMREWKANGQPLDTMAQSYGLNDLFNSDQLRLAASYSDEDHDKAYGQFKSDIPKFAIAQKTEDAATDQLKEWNDTWTRIRRSIESSFMTITPAITKIGTSFGELVDGLAKSPEVKDDLNQLDDGLKGILPFFKAVSDFNKNNPLPDPYKAGESTRSWLDKHFGTDHPDTNWSGYDPNAPTPVTPSTSESGPYAELLKRARDKYTLPAGLQALQIQVESRGNPNAENPVTHAKGLMQLMPDTAKTMGVNPFDPTQSIDAGARLLAQYRKIYGTMGKGLAGYDGDTHISADEKKYRTWLMGAKPETLNYLRPFQDAGYDLGLSPEEVKYLMAHSKARDDLKLKPDQDKLNENDFQIIDTSKGKPAQPVDPYLESMANLSKLIAMAKDGGGAQFRSPDRANPASPQPVNVNLNVKVSTPAGASTNVALNGVPQ